MTAKEMFEKLGYDRYYNSVTAISYSYGDLENCSVITFLKNRKHIGLFGGKYAATDLPNYEYIEDDYKLFIAINKQIEELGWNER